MQNSRSAYRPKPHLLERMWLEEGTAINQITYQWPCPQASTYGNPWHISTHDHHGKVWHSTMAPCNAWNFMSSSTVQLWTESLWSSNWSASLLTDSRFFRTVLELHRLAPWTMGTCGRSVDISVSLRTNIASQEMWSFTWGFLHHTSIYINFGWTKFQGAEKDDAGVNSCLGYSSV